MNKNRSAREKRFHEKWVQQQRQKQQDIIKGKDYQQMILDDPYMGSAAEPVEQAIKAARRERDYYESQLGEMVTIVGRANANIKVLEDMVRERDALVAQQKEEIRLLKERLYKAEQQNKGLEDALRLLGNNNQQQEN